MRKLILPFAVRAGARSAPIKCVIAVCAAALAVSWATGVAHDEIVLGLAFVPVFMVTTLMAVVSVDSLWDAEEFDLTLPFHRRDIINARVIAALALMAFLAVPVCAVAVIVSCSAGLHGHMMILSTALILGSMAAFLLAVFLAGLFSTMSWPEFFASSGVPLSILLTGAAAFLALQFSAAWVAGASACLIVAGWLLNARQYERINIGGPADEVADSSAVAEPGRIGRAAQWLLARLSPPNRLAVRLIWLRPWYLLLMAWVVSMAAFRGGLEDMVFGSMLFLTGLIKGTPEELVQFITRERAFRSALVPLVGAGFVAGSVAAIVTRTPDRVLDGLALALVMAASAWVVIPSAWEQRRSPVLTLRLVAWVLLLLVIFQNCLPLVGDVCRGAAQALGRISLPSAFPSPWSQAVLLILGTTLLCWLAERKFRHFEPPSSAQ